MIDSVIALKVHNLFWIIENDYKSLLIPQEIMSEVEQEKSWHVLKRTFRNSDDAIKTQI